jgi:signal-transduction protein with cAMP-binding, CBS, and nucleotidyltransferase domain
MVDQQTLLAKISEELFHKLFLPRFNERQKNLSCFLKTVSIFNGLPNSFFQEFSRFLEDEAAHPDQKVISRSQKAKFVYFIRKGEVELRRFTDKKPAGSPNYVITGKGYTTQHLREGDTFGMEGELG